MLRKNYLEQKSYCITCMDERTDGKAEDNKMNGKISIIIPCYNVEQYIDRCLASVVNQTIGLDKLEIICVNDASTDGTWEKLSAWERQYQEQILLIDCEKNGKLGRARNIGLHHATGDYIAFLDADDWMEPDSYERLYQLIREYDCEIVQFWFVRDSGQGDVWQTQKRREQEDFCLELTDLEEKRKFLATAIMDNGCTNKLYTREFIFDHQLRFPEGRAYEDIYWGVLAQLHARRVYFLNEKLYHYYINPNSIVLKKDEPYHMDIFYTTMEMWQECRRRGAMETYPREMELNFLIYYYLGGLKMLALRYTDLKYDKYCQMCETVRKTVPDYKNNPYLTQVLSDMQQLQVALIDQDISREEFAQVVRLLRGEM